MPYQNNNQNGNSKGFYKTDISTSSVAFFGGDTMLLTKFGTNYLTITFRDAVVDASGSRKYPRPTDGDMQNSVAISKEIAEAFLDKIDEIFVPMFCEYVDRHLADNTFSKIVSVGVPLNREGTKILDITSGRPGPNGYEPALRVHFDVGGERIPRASKVLQFGSYPVFIGYDPATGDSEKIVVSYPQVLIFKKVLEAFIYSQINGTAHEVENKLHDRITNMNTVLNALADKTGIPHAQTYQYSKPDNNTATNNTPAPAANVEITEYAGDISSMLGSDMPFEV